MSAQNCHSTPRNVRGERRSDRIFENRALRRKYGNKREKVTGEQRMLLDVGVCVL
jgi:hypothetical protein